MSPQSASPARVDPDARARRPPVRARPGRTARAAPPRRRAGDDGDFAAQPTPRAYLDDPEPLLLNLTRCVIEVLAGVRELDQLSRWLTHDVYRHLLKRVVLASRARRVKGQTARRPQLAFGSVTMHEPRDGVIEAVVIVHQRIRSRAVAIRLEGFDRRWRASSIHVL